MENKSGSFCLYIAYGSNLHPIRIGKRCKSELITTGRLKGRRLVFHKQGEGSSGKCNIPSSTNPNDVVWVAIFKIPQSEKSKLDDAEGLGRGYHEEQLEVDTESGPLTGTAYIADTDSIDDNLKPFDWYKEMVILGAKYHRFSAEYRNIILATPSKPDLNKKRASDQWKTIEEMKKAANNVLEGLVPH